MSKTTVYKVEVMIVNHDGLDDEEIIVSIEDTHYPNHCIIPRVMKITTAQVDWSDEHPLNKRNTCDEAYKELFTNWPGGSTPQPK